MSSPEPSSGSTPAGIAESALERHGPWAFVLIGVAMIVVAAIGYLDASVSIAFVAVGAGLMALGGLAARIEGTVKVGLQGFELALRARQALLDARHEVEATDPEEAKRIDEKVDELDNWFEIYLREVSKRPGVSPYAQAALLQRTYQAAHPTGRYRGGGVVQGVDTEDVGSGRYRGGAVVPGVDTEESQPDTKPDPGAE
jgi:hypothetical protein